MSKITPQIDYSFKNDRAHKSRQRAINEARLLPTFRTFMTILNYLAGILAIIATIGIVLALMSAFSILLNS